LPIPIFTEICIIFEDPREKQMNDLWLFPLKEYIQKFLDLFHCGLKLSLFVYDLKEVQSWLQRFYIIISLVAILSFRVIPQLLFFLAKALYNLLF